MTVIPTPSLNEYHIQEWKAFAKEQYDLQVEDGTWDEGEEPEFDEYYIQDLAESYWGNFGDLEDTETTWQNIDYSAGVYLGEIEENNITNRVILHDTTTYNDEGEEFIKDVDMVEVTLMNSNPDMYGDECEKTIKEIIFELADQKMFEMMVEVTGKEGVGNYITNEMTSRRPELLEVLLEWNQHLTHDEVFTSMIETTNGTITAFMENNGIDW